MVDQTSGGSGSSGDSSDYYVSGGVNWAGFTLEQLVSMVADQASAPQLERLALDWRSTGDGVVDAADYLADALDDLMNYWSGASAEKARHTVALNAQWVADLGTTARDMGSPIEEAAGALKSAQEAMPKLPAVPPVEQPGSAPQGAEQVAALTGSPLGAAVGATAAGSESAFAAQAEQAELKRVAVETMQRFEAAAVGIDRATPRFLGQNNKLVPRDDGLHHDPGSGVWISQISTATGVDVRWQILTSLPDGATAAQRASGDVASGNMGSLTGTGFGGLGVGGGGGGMLMGGLGAGRSALGGLGGGDGAERVGAVPNRGAALPTTPSGAVIGGVNSAGGMNGAMGAAPMGAGMGMGAGAAQPHRRRFPFDADDPFDTGQKASPPVIGL
ncbi:PPE domain-containing protein [Actinophytocola sp.]|uniref:PPE domain-containing protein n=1 Tax=Actinophytocola sp. TaxID=1872138 RepID=UPI002EDBAADE